MDSQNNDVIINIENINNPIEIEEVEFVKHKPKAVPYNPSTSDDESYGYETKQRTFTCWTRAQRRFIRDWIIWGIKTIVILVLGSITYITHRDFFVGWTIAIFLLMLFSCIMRLPQLLYRCLKGYPVPHILWMDGISKPLFRFL